MTYREALEYLGVHESDYGPYKRPEDLGTSLPIDVCPVAYRPATPQDIWLYSNPFRIETDNPFGKRSKICTDKIGSGSTKVIVVEKGEFFVDLGVES